MDESQSPKDKADLKSLNRWLGILVVFIILWGIGMFFYVEKKTEQVANRPIPVVMLDPASGKITSIAYTNLVPSSFTAPAKTNDVSIHPSFEQKKSYENMDFVVINYFFVAGLVVEKNGNNYTVMYKDHNHVLQKTIVPVEMLLSPTSYNGVNPLSLLNP